MNLEYFLLGGYGQFVWPSFIFTIMTCLFLYLKTKKEMQKQEKIFFSKYAKINNVAKIEFPEGKKTVKKVLSNSSV